MTTFIFPSDTFNPKQVDEAFAEQAEAILAMDGSILLFDMDELLRCNGPKSGLKFRMLGGGILNSIHGAHARHENNAVYRGWMLTVHQYSTLEIVLRHYGIKMLTEMPNYLKAHHLPGWYEEFKSITPKTVWQNRHDAQTFEDLVAPLTSGAFIVKDFVKSRKAEWDTACYAPSLETLETVSNEFIRLQVEDKVLTGGLVIREFEDLDTTAGEARVWWVDGNIALMTAHPDTPNLLPAVDPLFLDVVQPHVQRLGCPFVTTDIAKLADGCWRVIEVGDGQVSGLPAGADATGLWEALSR